MNIGEIAFYVGIGVGDFLIATEWAKYGIWELGIQKPINSKAVTGAFIGVITFFIGGLAHKFYGFNSSNVVLGSITGAATLWLLVFRYMLLPPGLNAFNKARIRTNFWLITGNYMPGERLNERANSLREFGFAKTAERLFRRSIELQLKGQKIQSIQKVIDITDDMVAGWGDKYRIRCPGCPFEINIPIAPSQTMSGVCNMCGAMSTVRIEGDKIYINTMLPKPLRIVSNQNRCNAATGYEELALLYRMMHRFDEAKEALEKAREIINVLLEEDPEKPDYLKLKSIIIFRMAEINHVQGNHKNARIGYEESLAIDRKLGDAEGIKINEALLEKISA